MREASSRNLHHGFLMANVSYPISHAADPRNIGLDIPITRHLRCGNGDFSHGW
jgi:hypothetical protein